jgi:hypothetical protein
LEGGKLERLLDRCIKVGPFFRHSLHFRHYGYQTGRSVETVFHNLVYEIDRTLEDGLLLLGTFLDIEVAFDITAFESMCKAAEENGVVR